MTYKNYMRLVHDYSIPLYIRACARSNNHANLCMLVSCNSRANMWL